MQADPSQIPDDDLLHAIARGDQSALAACYDRYRLILFSLILRILQAALNARGMFVFDQQTGRAMLMTEGLPAPPADKAYEVWFIPKGPSPMPGKMFTVDAAGRAMVSEQIPEEARESAVFAITLEPKRGSATPTGAIYLSSPSS